MADALLIVMPVPKLCTPTSCEPRFAEAGTVSVPWGGGPPVPPVPLTANDCGLPMPLLTTLIWPLRAPVAAGVNCRLTWHDDNGLTNVPGMQVVLTIVNSSGLLLATLVIVTAALPMLLTLRDTTELPMPTPTAPKFTAAGIASWLVAPPWKVAR